MATSKRGGKKPAQKTIPKKAGKKPAKKAAKKKVESKSVRMAAADDNTSLDTLYILDGSDNTVSLEVKVGAQGQTSDMTIKLNNSIVKANHPGDFPETPLGNNRQLDGKKLNIVATIADTSRTTNFTGLTINLKGGVSPDSFSLFKTVDAEGASADYICIIEFFKP